MAPTEKSTAEKNRVAARGAHALPLLALALGALVAGVYVLVGDTMYLVLWAVAGYCVFSALFIRYGKRHTVMAICSRCVKLQNKGPVSALVNRALVWYFHRRITDSKAAIVIAAGGFVTTVVYDSLEKPHAVLLFVVAYEVFIVQFALLLRSMVIHRGYESSCTLCAEGDDPHPYGRVSASELED